MTPINFEIKFILLLSVFDDIYGPQVIASYPEILVEKENKDLKSIISSLFDLSSNIPEMEWKFLYSDQVFTSQNIRISVLDDDVRGGLRDFLISVVLTPTYATPTAAVALSWEALFILEDQIKNSDVFSTNMSLDGLNYDRLKEILGGSYQEIKQSLKFHIDLIEPESFEFV